MRNVASLLLGRRILLWDTMLTCFTDRDSVLDRDQI